MKTIENILESKGLKDVNIISSIRITEKYILWDDIDLGEVLTQNELSFFKSEILTKGLNYFSNIIEYSIYVDKNFKFSSTFFSSKTLKNLYVNGGKLLASSKFDLPVLEKLTFSSVSFSKLNSSILQSHNLKELNLFHSNIKRLPDDLHHLHQLKSLSVYNKIESLDNVIFPESIEIIDLRGNSISEINTSIITKNIKKIDLSQNPLFKVKISESKNVLIFDISTTPLGCFEDNYNKIRDFIPNVFFSEPTYNPIDSNPKVYDLSNYDQYLNDFYESLSEKWRESDDPEFKRPFKVNKELITIKKSDFHKTEINID